MRTGERALAQLRSWRGRARRWQLRAALDYPADLDKALRAAQDRGAVAVHRDGEDPEEDVVRLTAGAP